MTIFFMVYLFKYYFVRFYSLLSYVSFCYNFKEKKLYSKWFE